MIVVNAFIERNFNWNTCATW